MADIKMLELNDIIEEIQIHRKQQQDIFYSTEKEESKRVKLMEILDDIIEGHIDRMKIVINQPIKEYRRPYDW